MKLIKKNLEDDVYKTEIKLEIRENYFPKDIATLQKHMLMTQILEKAIEKLKTLSKEELYEALEKILNFNGYTDEQKVFLSKKIVFLVKSQVNIGVKSEEKRTEKQNDAYWLLLEQVSGEMISQGISLKSLLEVLDITPTKESLHLIFKEILFRKFNKKSTTKMTKNEMSECLDDFLLGINQTGMEVYFPDENRNNLLDYYNLI